MWFKDIRSVVADGVKEFKQGALSEVQQGFSETSSVVTKEIKLAKEKGVSAWAAKDRKPKSSAVLHKSTVKGSLNAVQEGPAGAGVNNQAAASFADGWEEDDDEVGGGSGSAPLPSVSAIQTMWKQEGERQGLTTEEWGDDFADVPLDDPHRNGPGDSGDGPDKILASSSQSPASVEKAFDVSGEEPSSLHLPPPNQKPRASVKESLPDVSDGKDEEDIEEDDLNWGEENQKPSSAIAEKSLSSPALASDDQASMAQKLRTAEQRAQNAQNRLDESAAAAERERARWMEERAQLQRQVASLQSTVDAGNKEREVLESSVNQLANQLESRLTALSGNVEARDAEVTQLREENESLSSAFEEMRILLKQSVDERGRLSEELLGMERQLTRARKEGADAVAALEASKREHMEASMALAEANANAQQLQAADMALSSEARAHLEARAEAAKAEAAELRQALETASERCRKAEAAREDAEKARLEAERLRREAQAEVQTAHCAAEAERAQRAEAEGQSEQLKSESERRARVFNNAVKAAVQKIQRELEEQNADLQIRVRQAEAAAAMAAEKTAAAEAATEEAYREAAARNADAEAAGELAVSAQEAADRAREKERAALRRAEEAAARCHHAERGREAVQTELSAALARSKTADAEAARSAAALAELKEATSARVLALETEASLLRERAEAAAQGAAASSVAADAASRDAEARRAEAEAERVKLSKEVEELQAEVEELRSSRAARPTFTLPSGQEILAQLGLDKLREERLQLKGKPPPPTLESVEVGALPRKRNKRANKVGDVSGLISTRTWVLIIYAALLHLAVMISYTKRHDLRTVCSEYASEQANSFLPDHLPHRSNLP